MDSFLALESWKEQLNNTNDTKIVVMLVGNKIDCENKVVSSEMGQEYARSQGWGFIEVSAKTDVGIQAAFNGLITNIYAQVNQKHKIGNNEPAANI